MCSEKFVTQSAVARLCHSKSSVCLSVCLSVCPSVTLRYAFHTGWNTSIIISRTIASGFCSGWPQHGQSGATGTPPKLGWNRGGVRSTKNLQYLRNGARQDQGYNDRLIGSRIRAFDWCQNQWPWMTISGWNVTLAEIKKITEPTREIWIKIDSYYQRQNVGQCF